MKMLLILSCWIIAGITAEDPPTLHYRVTNSSLCLKVEKKSPPYKQLTWVFNGKAVVFNKNIISKYTDRVDYDPVTHVLCVNHLTEADSGVYKVSFFDSNFTESAETHRLILQEAVPSPVIRISVLHSNLSAGSCNLTVNCSVLDEWLWSVCDEDSCRTSQRSFAKVNITIFSDDRSVVCSGNNHVSASNVSEAIEPTCFRKFNPEHKETPAPPLGVTIAIIIIATVVCPCLCVLIACVAKRLCSTKCDHHQVQSSTVELIQNQPMEAQPQPAHRDSTSSSSQAEASYENIDTTQPRQASSPREESESNQTVSTVYDVLQPPNATDNGKDTKEHKKIQEMSTSRSVTPVDTVYSVLQKPKSLTSQHKDDKEVDMTSKTCDHIT